MKARLTTKKRRIAKAHIKGKLHKEIAKVEYPNQTEQAGIVSVGRVLKDKQVQSYIEQSKLQVLKEANVTWETIIRPRLEAIEAVKIFNGVEVPDHSIRLKAANDLERMMESKLVDDSTREKINNLPADVNEVELQKIMFRRV